MICFYHEEDLDGRCAAAIVYKARPTCTLIGVSHNGAGIPVDKVAPGEEVILVDLAPASVEQLLQMQRRAGRLIWIDHHQDALQAFAPFRLDGLQLQGYAACELAWRYFFPEEALPLAVYLLGRYDVWDHGADERILDFQSGMWSVETEPKAARWTDLLEMGDGSGYVSTRVPDYGALIQEFVKIGAHINRYKAYRDTSVAQARQFVTEFEGYRALAVNERGNRGVLAAGFDPDLHDLMLGFVWERDHWRVSLRSEPGGPDVAELARRFGGNGHPAAAGFTCPGCCLPFPPYL